MYLTTREVESRGWTKGLIKRFLPEPSKTKNNYPYGVTYFYHINRVASLEDSPEFKTLQEKALRKREQGKEIAERRRRENIENVNALPITVERLSPDELLNRAIRSYNNWQSEKACRSYSYEETSVATADSNPSFLERITVNYIRHNLTRYDNLLAKQYGQIGKFDVIDIIQKRVFEAIRETYPEYAEEIERQMKSKGLC